MAGGADRVRQLLESLGWSQAKLARDLGVHAYTVTRWVQGDPPRWVVRYLEVMVECRTLADRLRDLTGGT